MAVGKRWPRSAPGLAIGLLIGLAGCQSLPVPRAHPAFKAGSEDPSAPPPAGQVAPAPLPAAVPATEDSVPPPGAAPAPMAAANEPLPPLPADKVETAPTEAQPALAEVSREPENSLAGGAVKGPKSGPPFDPVLDELIAKAQAYRQGQAESHPAEASPAPARAPEPAPEPPTGLGTLTADPLADILNQADQQAPVVNPPAAALKIEPQTSEPSEPPAQPPAPSAADQKDPEPSPAATPDPPAPKASETPASATEPAHDSATAGPGRAAEPAASALAISDLRLCRRVLGFGNFMPLDTSACKAGQTVILYCEMTGVCYEADQSQFRSRITSRVEILPESGGAPLWSQALGEADDTCNHPRRDYYVNYRFALPRNLAPGPYQLRLTQTDLHTEQTAVHGLSLTIQP